MFYLGFFVTFSWGQLPKFVSLEAVPWMFIGYGIALLTGSFGSGRAFDRFGWKPLMLINCILMVIAFAAVPFGDSTKTVWPFFLATFCMGMCEAIQNCVQQSTLMMYFSGNINPILSIFRCVTAAGTSVGFLLPLVLNYVYLELVILGLMVIGVGLFAYHETKFGGSTSYSVEETQATPPVI
jgi:MFS family permease